MDFSSQLPLRRAIDEARLMKGVKYQQIFNSFALRSLILAVIYLFASKSRKSSDFRYE